MSKPRIFLVIPMLFAFLIASFQSANSQTTALEIAKSNVVSRCLVERRGESLFIPVETN